MKIIKSSKGSKDFYDYLVSFFGQDDLVVYDRRDCFPIDPTKKWGNEFRKDNPYKDSDYQNLHIEKWFKKEVLPSDTKKKEVLKWNSRKVIESRKYNNDDSFKTRYKVNKFLEGNVYHFILEVGFVHYIFEVERYIDDVNTSAIHLDYSIVEVQRVEKDKRLCEEPMCLCPCSYQRKYFFTESDLFVVKKDDKKALIKNPILYSTYIPKLIDASEIWNNLYEYISSLRDKEFVDSRTNDEHIESHGFDKKISFRHRK